MNMDLLRKHIKAYQKRVKADPEKHMGESAERLERRRFYQSWTRERIIGMTVDEFEGYLSMLWAMLIWGNKKYITNKMIEDNGFDVLKNELAELVWGKSSVDVRWDRFRSIIKGIGPAMMSEILSHVHPDECMLWNRRAFAGLNYLGVKNLPRYNYQLTGRRYQELSGTTKKIADELAAYGFKEADLLTADYFIWEELQVESNLSQMFKKAEEEDAPVEVEKADNETSEFIHNEIRDKLADIGLWLGLESQTEVKVADGSRVDTIWQQTVGNMGRVIYVFEVQTKGGIDSLLMNLLKSLNNPAVQGVVAVSDAQQLERIKKHAAGVQGLKDKLKYWDYTKVLQIHEALETVNGEINSLGLVPSGF